MSNTNLALIQSTADLMTVGTAMGKSGFFGVDRTEAGVVILMTCLAEGITPHDYARTYDTIGGKPRKKAMAALAEFKKRGGKFKWLKTGDDGNEAELWLKDVDGNEIATRYSIADAKRAELSFKAGSNWVKSPANMLRARCASNGVAMIAPEIYAGEADHDVEFRAAHELLVSEPQPKPINSRLFNPVTGEPLPSPVATVQAVDVVAYSKEDSTAAKAALQSIESIKSDVDNLNMDPSTVDVSIVPDSTAPATAAPFAARAGKGGVGIDAETQSAIVSAIGEENCEAALRWMVEARQWIKPLENFGALSVNRAQAILNKPREFVAKVTAK